MVNQVNIRMCQSEKKNQKNIIISLNPEIILYCEGFSQMRICSDFE